MKYSLRTIIIAAVAAFIIGNISAVFVGSLIMRRIARNIVAEVIEGSAPNGHTRRGVRREQFMMNAVGRNLGLSDEQKKALTTVLKKHQPEVDAIKQNTRSELKDLFRSMTNEAYPILTDAQKEQIDAFINR